MTWLIGLVICPLSAIAIVCPSAANEGIRPFEKLHVQKLAQPRVNALQVGDFGPTESWLLRRLRSPGKQRQYQLQNICKDLADSSVGRSLLSAQA